MATATATTRANAIADRGKARAQVSQLTNYAWTGTDKRGVKMKGDYAAKNASMVKAELRRQGINPLSVKPKGKPLFGSAGNTIKARDIAVFSRQIAVMMAAGVPMVQGIEIMATGSVQPAHEEHAQRRQGQHRRRFVTARGDGQISGAVRRALPQPGQGR